MNKTPNKSMRQSLLAQRSMRTGETGTGTEPPAQERGAPAPVVPDPGAPAGGRAGAARPLDAGALCARCDPAQFHFETTATLPEPRAAFGQARAVDAVDRALAIAGRGFNVFVLGEPGSSRHATVRRLLQAHAAARPAPADWCYVNNFADANKPRVLSLPAGEGIRLHAAMERFVAELGKAIAAALDSDEYRLRIEAIQKEFKQQEERALEELGDSAAQQGVALLRTPAGFAFAPLKDGQPLDPAQFDKLPQAERDRIAATVQSLRERLDRISHELPRVRREMQQRVRDATRETMALAVGHLIEELKERFAALPQVQAFLDEVLADVTEAGAQLHEQKDVDDEAFGGLAGTVSVGRYRVNLLVGHGPQDHAPIVEPDNPTHANLAGRVDQFAHMGTLLTNFMLVKPGALHLANGGYLMLDAVKVIAQPYAWEGLKRALSSGRLCIESLAQLMGWMSTVPLEPEPIPLSVKVVLFGERLHYYLLQDLDPEFDELFKVAADFEDDVPRDEPGVAQFALLLGSLARERAIRPLDRGAVARLVEHASRMAGDAHKLSTRVRELADVLSEADHEAARSGLAVIAREHVAQALAARIRRADRLRGSMLEAVQRETLLIASSGSHAGQINGLAVHELGGFRFGHPVRITATARVGEGDLVDIERESTLGKPIHSKGVMILASFLGARFAQHTPLSLSASLVFEQSYGAVEGDSASLAELCALLSALAGVPIDQSLAVTGSVNQHGQVQAVGGINEKIEGFFDVCSARGLDGHQGVLIPAANAQHLMLRDDVVEAAAQGRFHVIAVDHVDTAIEVLTGVPAQEPDGKGALPERTINRLVAARLEQMSRARQAHGLAHGAREPLRRARHVPLPASAGRHAQKP
ncbi:MAG: AAA family ATPase [Burkholderiaceae bacterium]|nr:AAA family ATPase [Burkholderiaceae bacterium]